MNRMMNGCVTMIGYGSAPMPDAVTQTIEWRLDYLSNCGHAVSDRLRRTLTENVGLARFMVSGQTSTELAIGAANVAVANAMLHDSDFRVDQLQLVLCGGASADRQYPSAATQVQAALKIPALMAQGIDISAACTSFVSALHIANGMMRAYGIKYAVLAFGEAMFSQVADYDGPQDVNWALWGDGGGAVVLRYDSDGPRDEGLIFSRVVCDGASGGLAVSKGLGCAAGRLEKRSPHMPSGSEVQKYVLKNVSPFVQSCLNEAFSDGRPVSWLVPHAANRLMGRGIGQGLGLGHDQVLSMISERGNTSSASIPITLAHYMALDHFQPGDLTAIVGFGSGMEAGVVLYIQPSF